MQNKNREQIGTVDSFLVRPARLGDLPNLVAMRDALNALELTASPHAPIQRLSLDEFTALWGATLDDPTHCWRIVESLDQPIGFGLVYLLPKSRPLGAFIHWMYLDAAHRRAGLGRLLFDHLAAWALAQGASRIELQFIEGNLGAQQFWARMGFRPYAQKCVCYLGPAQGTT
jgi:GNAT superfamily N-acetyltransferase